MEQRDVHVVKQRAQQMVKSVDDVKWSQENDQND
jgi:hypothetical protein